MTTIRQLAEAFELWEKNYRVTPSEFRNQEECMRLDVSQVSIERAQYFYSLLEKVK